MEMFVCLAFFILLFAGMIVIVALGVRLRSNPIAWDSHVMWLKRRPWTWRVALRIGLILLCLQLAVVGFIQTAKALGWLTGQEPGSWSMLVQGLFFHVASLLLLVVVIREYGFSWHEAFGLKKHDFINHIGQGIICYLAVLPFFFSASLIYRLVLFLFGYSITIQNVALFFLEPQSTWALICLLVIGVVVAPVAEEALFRGIILPLLMKRIGAGAAIFVTSLLFAIIHFHLPSIIPLFVLALALSIAYIMTKSIVVPIVMHVFFNGMSLALLLTIAG